MQYRDTGELPGAHQILLKRRLPIKLCPPFAYVDNFPLFGWLGSQVQAEPIKNNVDVTDEKRESFQSQLLEQGTSICFSLHCFGLGSCTADLLQRAEKVWNKDPENKTIKEYRQSDLEFTILLFDFLLFIDLHFMTSIYIFFF